MTVVQKLFDYTQYSTAFRHIHYYSSKLVTKYMHSIQPTTIVKYTQHSEEDVITNYMLLSTTYSQKHTNARDNTYQQLTDSWDNTCGKLTDS